MKTFRIYTYAQAARDLHTHRIFGQDNDSKLTPEGRRQASQVGQRLAYLIRQRKLGTEAVYLASSPANRAKVLLALACETAGIMRGKIDVHPGLQELDQGLWTGRDPHESLPLDNGTKAHYVCVYDRLFDYDLGGVETLRAATDRIMTALQDIGSRMPPDSTALIAGHEMITRLAVNKISRQNLLARRVTYAAETCLTLDEKHWQVRYASLSTNKPDNPITNALWRDPLAVWP